MKINLRFRGIADYLKLHRKQAALAFAFGCIVLLSWALVRSYYETAELGAAYPYSPLGLQEFVHFRLTVLGIDEVNRIAEVRAEVISHWNETENHMRILRLRGMPPIVVMTVTGPDPNSKSAAIFPLAALDQQTFLDQKQLSLPPLPTDGVRPDDFVSDLIPPPPILGEPRKATLYFGPLTLRDVAPSFDALGVTALANLKSYAIDATPGPTYKTEPPPPLSAELEMVGDPWRYPFDHYVMIGEILCNVFISKDSKDFRSFDVQQTYVHVQSPGFVQKYLSIDDLRRLRRSAPQTRAHLIIKQHLEAGLQIGNEDFVFDYLDKVDQVRKRSFAVEIRRPFFLRFFSVFLLVVTVASMAYYSVKSTVREFGLQAVAYFAGLWAIRQILMSNGPKSFTLVDYVVLTLYVGLIAALVAKAIYTPKVVPH